MRSISTGIMLLKRIFIFANVIKAFLNKTILSIQFYEVVLKVV